jgi:hypothetical protein
MRRAVIITAIVGSALLGSTPSFAQRIHPWCLKATTGRGATVDLCYFRTFERCNQERFNYGTTSFCIVNPEYYFRYGEPPQRPRGARRTMAR